MSLQPGDVVDRYRIEALIGTGGMASVYRVRHTLLDSLHALKVLHPELLRDDEARERFLAEGRIQAQLFHPYIAAVTDLVSAEGVAGLVMEYMEGRSLEDLVQADGPRSPADALEILRPVLLGVQHAHEAGVVHRDLKPSNIYLCSRTRGMVRPVVLDFGIAKVTEASALSSLRLKRTVAGMRMGTVQYMSPEQVVSSADVDARCDIYALGAILFEMLTGVPPFDGEHDYEVMQRIVEDGLGDIRARVPAEGQVFVPAITRAMSRDPEDRFVDCMAFRDALDRALHGGGAEAPAAQVAVSEVASPPAVSSTYAVLVQWPDAAAEEIHVLDEDRWLLDPFNDQVKPLARKRRIAMSHALLIRDDEGWTIQPGGRGRTMPTLVDGERIRSMRRLVGGEDIVVGSSRFRFVRP